MRLIKQQQKEKHFPFVFIFHINIHRKWVIFKKKLRICIVSCTFVFVITSTTSFPDV